MKIIGLTGSIGMGKTTTAEMFKKHGVPTIDADQIVHQLYENEAVALIEEAFPGTTDGKTVDREKLSASVIGQRDSFKKLEAIIHPLVRQKQDEFIKSHREQGTDLVLLDIPLLFETGAQSRVDIVVVVTCDPEIQKKRVLARKNMNIDKFNAILKKQLPDAEKRKLADHIVDTSVSFEETEAQVIALLSNLRQN
ncbi:MAG: dephospho-CoA kinase [Lentilitoribacter sp.]